MCAVYIKFNIYLLNTAMLEMWDEKFDRKENLVSCCCAPSFASITFLHQPACPFCFSLLFLFHFVLQLYLNVVTVIWSWEILSRSIDIWFLCHNLFHLNSFFLWIICAFWSHDSWVTSIYDYFVCYVVQHWVLVSELASPTRLGQVKRLSAEKYFAFSEFMFDGSATTIGGRNSLDAPIPWHLDKFKMPKISPML